MRVIKKTAEKSQSLCWENNRNILALAKLTQRKYAYTRQYRKGHKSAESRDYKKANGKLKKKKKQNVSNRCAQQGIFLEPFRFFVTVTMQLNVKKESSIHNGGSASVFGAGSYSFVL